MRLEHAPPIAKRRSRGRLRTSDLNRLYRHLLYMAQDGRCAGCGLHLWPSDQLSSESPHYPTYDHFHPRHLGGRRNLRNGLLKHRECNERRGASMPTGCDAIWHQSVQVRLGAMLGWGQDQ